MGIIYCHKNKVSGRCYVGQTKHTLDERISRNPLHSYRHNKQLINDISTYGWDAFESCVLETVDDSLLDEKETYWITELSKTTELYNKQMTGTSNSKRTVRRLNTVDEETSALFCTLYEDENLSASEISKLTGYSANTVLRWLRTCGVNVEYRGKISSKQAEQKCKVDKFLSQRVCPVCGKIFKRKSLSEKTCSNKCSRTYLYRMSDEERVRVDMEYNMFVASYRELLSSMISERQEYKNKLETICNDKHKSMEKDITEKIENKVVKHSKDEKLLWKDDDVECKRLLDLILNSGVNLLCFGFNSKLCGMFPNDLTKRKVLYLLRKYGVPHFERSSSNPTNLKF